MVPWQLCSQEIAGNDRVLHCLQHQLTPETPDLSLLLSHMAEKQQAQVKELKRQHLANEQGGSAAAAKGVAGPESFRTGSIATNSSQFESCAIALRVRLLLGWC